MKFHRPTFFLSEARESFSMAMNALVAHKLRSALTLLGVLIGVFSIIVVMTAMRVLKNNIESEMSSLGAQTFAIQKWPAVYFGSGGFEKYWRRKNITLEIGRLVQEKATLAASVGIDNRFWAGQIETHLAKTPPNVSLFGATPGCFPARKWIVDEGRALTDLDVDAVRYVCVLGAGPAKTLFPFGAPIGEHIQLNGISYAVIGTLAPMGGNTAGDNDNFAIIPLTTALNRFGRRRSLSIVVQAASLASYDDTVEQVRGILRVARKVPPDAEDDFDVLSNDSIIAQFDSLTRAVRIGVAAVSSVALIAAGIGIMNIMLVSVTERTREIGIRRAVGAKKRNIMTQFIMEAIVLCEVGGAIGVVCGILAGNAVAWHMKIPPVIPVDWIILGLVICSVVGIVFGTYPAYKAANLDPIDSLRYE
jgi:putative ABC transport system permease protein